MSRAASTGVELVATFRRFSNNKAFITNFYEARLVLRIADGLLAWSWSLFAVRSGDETSCISLESTRPS